jgi:hypothetical protein
MVIRRLLEQVAGGGRDPCPVDSCAAEEFLGAAGGRSGVDGEPAYAGVAVGVGDPAVSNRIRFEPRQRAAIMRAEERPRAQPDSRILV